MTEPGFILKAYYVSVDGFPASPRFASSPAKARYQAYTDYSECRDISFRDFMKISRCTRAYEAPEYFGEPLTINGLKGFFVSRNSQYVQFVYAGEDVIFNVHPMDVMPEYLRPSSYRSEKSDA